MNMTFEKVYLACGSTDMRKSIDGLAAIVIECFDLDPFSPCLFVFCNRKRDKLKVSVRQPHIYIIGVGCFTVTV
ncbi:IS66 family insertion sequence element accessory protein TnpB [Virgibacillus dokdonensis]|uniref:IS66 family insertion sequence element accessory protein TnpB n=1 Tax=Virgibacillus dokdonensis TaxID=302167 RepID=UPI001132311E|nr:IS66 family insertion sequence element accessory protein TnpB [Virgibacillus dokdonensis]